MAIIGIIALVIVAFFIWRMPSREDVILKIMATETLIYREATVDEFRILKEGKLDEQLVATKDITERLHKAGKLSWKL